MRARRPLAERLWEKVDRDGPTMPGMDSPCWEWTASCDSGGYGQIMLADRGKPTRASRAAWIVVNGPIPDGLHVLHRCDNRRCVRAEPDGRGHLFLGTNTDNVHDMDAKGRRVTVAKRGEWHANAVLTTPLVEEARRLKAAGLTFDELAARFGVSRSTLAAAVSGRNWRWL